MDSIPTLTVSSLHLALLISLARPHSYVDLKFLYLISKCQANVHATMPGPCLMRKRSGLQHCICERNTKGNIYVDILNTETLSVPLNRWKLLSFIEV
ncbi:hypothetical protein EDB86DRAFT_2880464 [Lactarius hatsudake]|nr:hypothetical protein EDB86DRAFT_2880464 [Lactarius hatsudake]